VARRTEGLRRRRNVLTPGKTVFQARLAEIVDQCHSILGMVALATFVLSGIGLLIAGGSHDIMWSALTERTREIGIRKAIGARAARI